MRVIIQKVNNHVNPDTTNEEAFERDQTRLEDFCERNGIKVIDDVRRVNAICDRINFARDMNNMFDKLPNEIKGKFKMPASIDFSNMKSLGTVEDRIAVFKKQAAESQLEFPILFKLCTGMKSKFSHIFFCVNEESGLSEALDFEGFIDCNILCQAYLPHKERVYKIYGIGSWFKSPVRLSVPHNLMSSKKVVKFDS